MVEEIPFDELFKLALRSKTVMIKEEKTVTQYLSVDVDGKYTNLYLSEDDIDSLEKSYIFVCDQEIPVDEEDTIWNFNFSYDTKEAIIEHLIEEECVKCINNIINHLNNGRKHDLSKEQLIILKERFNKTRNELYRNDMEEITYV